MVKWEHACCALACLAQMEKQFTHERQENRAGLRRHPLVSGTDPGRLLLLLACECRRHFHDARPGVLLSTRRAT